MVGTGNYLIEDYCFAKTEIHSTIETQFKILSILVTASSAVFALLFESGHLPLVICGCLIIPGIYAFFGVLWLDQVYRQRRLATYVLTIEASSEFKDCMLECGISRGWETFIQARKKQEHKHGHKFIINVVSFLHKEKYTCSSIILNCTPFVRQYDILSNKWGVLLCQKEYQTNDIHRNLKSWSWKPCSNF